MIDILSFIRRRRVGLFSWHLPENNGIRIPTFAFSVSGSVGWSSNAAFDSVTRTDAFDLSLATRSFFDGSEVASTPTVYTRTCVLPAIDANVVATAKRFRFRVIADVTVTLGSTFDLTVGFGWVPAASTWISVPQTSTVLGYSTRRVQYDFEIDKPEYMLTPAIAAATSIRLTFASWVSSSNFSVTACDLYFIGWR